MKIKRFALKSISLGITILLAANQSLYGNAAFSGVGDMPHAVLDSAPQFLKQLDSRVSISDFFIPAKRKTDLGQILQDPHQKLVIYLEDAHGVTAAQKNIAETIRELSQEGSLREPWIALEGSQTGEIDHRILSAYPHWPTKNKIAEALLAKGLLSGADYFAVRYKPKAKLFGVEEGDLAEQNREAYRNFLPLKSQVDQAFRHLDKANSILKDRIYYGDLVELNQLVEKLERDISRFSVHLAQLQYLAEKNKISLKKYPSLNQFLELKRLDAKITGRPDLEKEKAEFSNLSRSLEGAKLFKDLNAFIEDIWNKLLFYDEAKDAYFINRSVRFYKKLFDFSLTPDEYQQYVAHPELYSFEALQEKIRKYYFILRPRSLRPTAKEMRLLEEAAQYPLKFYSLAEERNQLLSKNLASLLDQSPDKKVFFIAGGFHRDRITTALKALQIPYLVMTPKISSGEGQENYWRLLGEDVHNLSFPGLPHRGYPDPIEENQSMGLTGESIDSRLRGNDTSTVALEDGFARNEFRKAQIQALEQTHEPSRHLSAAFRQYQRRLNPFDQLMISETFPELAMKRSELRGIPIKVDILADKRLAENERVTKWLEDLSIKINQVLGKQLNVAILTYYLKQLNWNGNDFPVEKVRKFFQDDKSFALEFPSNSSYPIDWPKGTYENSRNIVLKIDIRGIKEFKDAGLAELYLAIILRNYFIGHGLRRDEEMPPKANNPADRDISKARAYNNQLLDQFLNLDEIPGIKRNQLQKAKDRKAFLEALKRISESKHFEGVPDILSELYRYITSFESWLAIAMPFDAAARSHLEQAKKPEKASEANALGEKAAKIYATIPPLNNRYKILSYIASGGFGAVYKVYDTHIRKERAIKVFDNRNRPKNETFRLKDEVENHNKVIGVPHFPQIHDQEGLMESRPGASGFLVLDLIEGEPLNLWLKRLSDEQAGEIMMQAAEGLQKFHEKGLIHRDLKPHNIMSKIDRDGTIKSVNILDLGLAKDEARGQITMAGAVMGTLGYMSPEMGGYGEVGPQSDIFQLGAILYQLLDSQGRIPGFSKQETQMNTMFATITNQVEGNYPVPEGSEPQLAKIAFKALAPLPGYLKKVVDEAAKRLRDFSKHTIDKNKAEELEEQKVKLRDNNGQVVSDKKIFQLEKILSKVQPSGEEENAVIIEEAIKAGNLLMRYETAGEMADDIKKWLELKGKKQKGKKSGPKLVPAAASSKAKKGAPALAETEILKPGVHPALPRRAGAAGSSVRKYIILAAAAFLVTVIGTLTTVFWPGQTNPTQPGSSQTTQPSDRISYDGSMEFKGNDDAVIIDSLLGKPSSITISAWAKTPHNNMYGGNILTMGGVFTLRSGIGSQGGIEGSWRMGKDEATRQNISFKPVNLDSAFHHILLTVKDNEQKLYFDGKLVKSSSFRVETNYQYANPNSTIIGNHGHDQNYAFQGNIADVVIINGVIEELELPTIMNVREFVNNKHLSDLPDIIKKNLLLYLPLDQKIRTQDLSGNNHSALIRGAPVFSKLQPPLRRAEVRYNQVSEYKSQNFIYSSLISNKNNALLILPFDDNLVDSYLKKMFPLPGVRVVFLAKRSEVRNVVDKYGPLEEIYNFRIIKSNLDISQLDSSHVEFKKLLMNAASSFGVPSKDLGRPVFYSEAFLTPEAGFQDLRNSDAIYINFNKKRFVNDLPYRLAYLISGVTLSKKSFDIIGNLFFQSQNGIMLSEHAILQFQKNLKAIIEIARAA